VYDTNASSGWQIFGGTSVASPIIGSVYALANNASSSNALASYPYANTGALNDVTSGSNGSCSPSYLCTAGPGYDGPTGLGTPNSTPAFSGVPPPKTAPSAPSVTASAGDTTVTLQWTEANNGGLTVTYSVSRGTSPGSLSPVAGAAGLSATTYTDTGLSNGTTYYYEVTATNTMGSIPSSPPVPSTPQTMALPGAPTLTAATSTTRGVALSWTVPPSNGSAITQYQLYRSTSSGAESAYVLVAACSTSPCTYNDSSTRRNRTYYYEVAAINGVGTGQLSNEASAIAR
jgi:fibronectin type 3 domain-containing protein